MWASCFIVNHDLDQDQNIHVNGVLHGLKIYAYLDHDQNSYVNEVMHDLKVVPLVSYLVQSEP